MQHILNIVGAITAPLGAILIFDGAKALSGEQYNLGMVRLAGGLGCFGIASLVADAMWEDTDFLSALKFGLFAACAVLTVASIYYGTFIGLCLALLPLLIPVAVVIWKVTTSKPVTSPSDSPAVLSPTQSQQKKCPNPRCRALTTDDELARYGGRCIGCRKLPLS